jgi:RNA polymerase sigma factor (sigma-70 family)
MSLRYNHVLGHTAAGSRDVPFMTPAMDDEWTSASFRAALLAMVRRRVPPGDADDVVQAALIEAVAAADRPHDPEGARRWIWGVARHKIADYHRRARREDVGDVPEQAALPSPAAERDLLRWAVGELPPGADAQRTFAWLLREGEGEKLESIADDERLPPPQVRQRVSRMRRLLRARWAQLATAGLVALVAYLAWRGARAPDEAPPRVAPRLVEAPEITVAVARGRGLRVDALRACDGAEWRRCLDGLDAARALDPAGDEAARVRAARQTARDALTREQPVPLAPPTTLSEYDGGVIVVAPADAAVAAPPVLPRPTASLRRDGS